MSDPGRCPQCGAALPPDAPPGICPKCLLGLGLGSEKGNSRDPGPTTPPSPTPPGRFVAPQPAELARHFPELEILELLGQGGMGAVYKARQRQLNRLVALKILPPEVARDPAFAQRFTREAQALAQLNHPQIVTVHDSGQAGGLYYFVMEYVDGVNLRRMLAEGKLSPAEALAIVPQVCEALQYAHDEGVVHRDIKPENILLDKKGRVKIADFGLARLVGQSRPDITLTGTQQVMGTPHYMAPEQMERPQAVDHRADIYSLGVVFYEMLTGELPLGRFQPPSKKVQVDVRLDEVVLRSLEKEPERRYQHISEVKTAVEAIPKDAKSAAGPQPNWASDGVVFVRLSVFTFLIWLIWSALLGLWHWGYVSDARWYFEKELPYTYLGGAWYLMSAMLAFCFTYWWYLLAKSPDSQRDFLDAWRCMQTPDRRAIRLWIPAVSFLAMWIGAMVLTMSLTNDDVQSTTLIALFIAAPLVAAASCSWAYRERVRFLLSSRREERIAKARAREPMTHVDHDALEAALDQVRIPAIGLIALGTIQCAIFAAVLLVGLMFGGFFLLRVAPREKSASEIPPAWEEHSGPMLERTMELQKDPEPPPPPPEATPDDSNRVTTPPPGE